MVGCFDIDSTVSSPAQCSQIIETKIQLQLFISHATFLLHKIDFSKPDLDGAPQRIHMTKSTGLR